MANCAVYGVVTSFRRSCRTPTACYVYHDRASGLTKFCSYLLEVCSATCCASSRTHISVESSQFTGKFAIRTEDRVDSFHLALLALGQVSLRCVLPANHAARRVSSRWCAACQSFDGPGFRCCDGEWFNLRAQPETFRDIWYVFILLRYVNSGPF